MLRIIARDRRGIFHCCGGERVGRMDLARATAEVFDLDASLLQSGEPDLGEFAGVSIPYDTSLSATDTSEQLDYQLPAIRQILHTYRQLREANALTLTTDV